MIRIDTTDSKVYQHSGSLAHAAPGSNPLPWVAALRPPTAVP